MDSPPCSSRSFDRTLWPAVGILIALFAFFEVTNVDLWLQDRLFDFERERWLVDRNDPLPRWIFYVGPKYVLYGFALLWCAALFRPPFGWVRRDMTIVLLQLIFVPLLVAISKDQTNVHCPSELIRYGGTVPYVRVLEHYPEGARPERPGHCFPAGHASGGFALVALAGLGRTRFGRRLGLGIGVGLGTYMGVYQMAKGAHYLSHTLITALFAWIMFLVWRRIIPARPKQVGNESN